MLMIPSLMCAEFARLGEEVDELVAAGADGFHLDIMDGSFVPNFGMGLGDVRAVCKRSPIPCDVHLMGREVRGLHRLVRRCRREDHVRPS